MSESKFYILSFGFMPIIRNWKTYYTLEEASSILDERIVERAERITKEILNKQKEKNILVREKCYV